MNFNESIDELIVKYNVDKHYPLFHQYLRAGKWIREWWRSCLCEKSVLIISNSETDICFFKNDLDFSKVKMMEFIDFSKDRDCLSLDRLSMYDQIVNISYWGKEEINSAIYGISTEAKVQSLYDLFEIDGLLFYGNYYDVFRKEYYNIKKLVRTTDYKEVDFNFICYYDRKCFIKSEEEKLKKFYLEKLIFDFIFIRDFCSVRKSIDLYESLFGDTDRYERFWTEIIFLLEKLKDNLGRRKQGDIIMVWLDQLEYSHGEKLNFFKDLEKKSLLFTQVYNVTPLTHPVETTLFYGKYTLDDKAYRYLKEDRRESPLVKRVQEQGYVFTSYSKLIGKETQCTDSMNILTPLSLLFWSALIDITESAQPKFCLIHEMAHTHTPCVSPVLNSNNYSFAYDWDSLDIEEQILQNEIQRKESEDYVDEQLKFYFDFIPENLYQIYFTDHGSELFERFHIILSFYHKDIKPHIQSELYSLIDFKALLCSVLGWEKNKEIQDLKRDYVIIQDVDRYNASDIKRIISKKEWQDYYLFGYQGVITSNAILLKFNNGIQEYCTKQCKDFLGKWKMLEELLHSGNDYLKDDRFYYSKYSYRIWQNYKQRVKKKEQLFQELLKEIFEFVPVGKMAIRGGGYHTYRLIMQLDWEQREKIGYIIDNKADCYASRIGYPIISLEQISEVQIDMVLISSFHYEKEWENEVQNLWSTGKLLPFYQYMSNRGLEFCQEFFALSLIDQDFEVGI